MRGFQSPSIRRVTSVVPITLVLLLVSGCAVSEPPPGLSRSALPILPEQYAAADGSPGAATGPWLATLQDPTLSALVVEAIQNNPDLRAAAARWEGASARVRVSRSRLFPTLDGTASAERRDDGFEVGSAGFLDPVGRLSLGFDVRWEVDLWGRLRHGVRASQHDADAAALELAHAHQSLAALVAESWFLATASLLQIQVAQERWEVEQRTLRVTKARADAGGGSDLDLELAGANVALAREALDEVRSAHEEAKRALEILIGRYPAAELAIAKTLPEQPALAAVGVPSALLERRADVIAADRRIAAAFHRHGSSRAARLPRVTISGSLGTLLDPSHTIWAIGANLLAPLVDGGRRRAEVAIADAAQREALAAYASTGLSAFREVETALSNLKYLGRREAQRRVADRRLRKASDIAKVRYDAGRLTILDLAQVRRQDFTNRSRLLAIRGARLQQWVRLRLAIGDSFSGPAPGSSNGAAQGSGREPE